MTLNSNTPTENSYEVLGIENDATDVEILGAYNKLIQENGSSDLNDDEKHERHYQIHYAYLNIKDIPSRMKYDHQLVTGLDYFDIMEDPSFDAKKYKEELRKIWRSEEPHGKDVRDKATIDIETALQGGIIELKTSQPETCSHCNGAGKLNRKCTACNSGYIYGKRCRYCEEGVLSSGCYYCKGKGWVFSNKTLKIRVSSGVVSGSTLTVKGKGLPNKYNEKRGDLILKFTVSGGDDWNVKGMNLIGSVSVPFPVAMLGGTVKQTMPSGKVFDVPIPERTRANKIITVEGAGLYNKQIDQTGNAQLAVVITVPKTRSTLDPEEESVLIDMMAKKP